MPRQQVALLDVTASRKPIGPKPKRKPAKRGPKDERLHIPDVQAALDAMWKAKPAKAIKRVGAAMMRLRDKSKL